MRQGLHFDTSFNGRGEREKGGGWIDKRQTGLTTFQEFLIGKVAHAYGLMHYWVTHTCGINHDCNSEVIFGIHLNNVITFVETN